MAKVAVIGGGIFGTTAAIVAARAGHHVELFEEGSELLQAASGINQYRLHRGYHYPRSFETARSALEAEQSFRREYGKAVVPGGRHLYAIAKNGSLVSGEQYLDFCRRANLSYTCVSLPEIVNPDAVELVIEGTEARFDPTRLRELVRGKLVQANVTVHFNVAADASLSTRFDRIIIATYAKTNAVLASFGVSYTEHQYEVCEKPIVSLPASFGMTDLVIMDGPFMCVDPFGTTGNYVLGNVVHAIHATNVGKDAIVPESIRPLLNRGIVTHPPMTRIGAFIEAGVPYIPALAQAKYLGSMFTVRTVLPRLEKTDARPTVVSQINGKFITIFSGKIGNCVRAAEEAMALL